MVQRLISGGQTGADQSIVAVGRRLRMPIGGLMPRGWLTEAGAQPHLGRLGFTESVSADYRVRTRQNVETERACPQRQQPRGCGRSAAPR